MSPAGTPRDWIAARFAEVLRPVLESMTDQSVQISWEAADPPETETGTEVLWWEQPLSGIAGALLFVGTPAETWGQAGTAALKAAGLEELDSNEAHNIWIEILSQSLSAIAREIGSGLGTEVACEAGSEYAPAQELTAWASVRVVFGEVSLPPLMVGMNDLLIAALACAQRRGGPAAGAPSLHQPQPEESPIQSSRTMDLLLEVELPVSISFGKTSLPLRDVLKLTTGSIVELNRTATDPVDVLVNQRLIARGEVVVVEGNYGVRIQKIASRQDRLRSIP
jgi:flagellar motor switch protein FliN/FliY